MNLTDMDATVDAPPQTITLVVNPGSGHGRAGRLLPGVEARLHRIRPRATVRVERSESFQHAGELCAAAVAAAQPDAGDILLVMGGDGMAHVGINACAGTRTPLGVLPAGTGNDFCRGAGLPRSVPQALDAVARGRLRRIDAAQVSGNLDAGADRFVGSIVSTGYDARVNHHANGMSGRLGGLAYAWAALAELATFEPIDYRLTLDGVERDLPAMLVAVGNAGVFGGGMRICPEALVNDGLLDVTIVHPVPRTTLLALLPLMFTGTFVRHPAIELRRARRVRVAGGDRSNPLITMADGEHLGSTPVELVCRAGALTVLG